MVNINAMLKAGVAIGQAVFIKTKIHLFIIKIALES